MPRATVRLIVLIATAVLVVWLGWRWLMPNDEAEIRAVLQRIEEGVSGTVEGDVSRLARAARLRDEFAPDVTVDAGAPYSRITGREAIIGSAARLGGAGRSLALRFDDVEITVDDGGQRAQANLTAEGRVTDPTGSQSFDARELNVEFRRLESRWVVSAVTLVRALEPVGER